MELQAYVRHPMTGEQHPVEVAGDVDARVLYRTASEVLGMEQEDFELLGGEEEEGLAREGAKVADLGLVSGAVLQAVPSSKARAKALLLERNGPPVTFASLKAAVADEDVELASLLLAAGAPPDPPPPHTASPLLAAAGVGSTDLCAALLSHGASLSCDGDTPLHRAAWGSHNDTCRLLLSHGADPSAADRLDETPLFGAAWTGNVLLCLLLLEHGAAVDHRNRFEKTPLYKAAWKGQVAVCRVLLAAGADPTYRSTKGNTPLHSAAANGALEACEVLVAARADPGITNHDNKKPLELCPRGMHKELQRLLSGAETVPRPAT